MGNAGGRRSTHVSWAGAATGEDGGNGVSCRLRCVLPSSARESEGRDRTGRAEVPVIWAEKAGLAWWRTGGALTLFTRAGLDLLGLVIAGPPVETSSSVG